MDAAKNRRRKRRRYLIIATVTILTLVLLSTLLAIIFRPKRPKTTVNSVRLRNFAVSVDALQLNLDVNISLDANITIFNPNKVGLKYTNSSAFLDYRGQVVGQVPIPAGQILAGQRVSMNLTLTVMADRFVSQFREVVADVASGSIPLSTRTRISGKVNVGFFKIRVFSYATCNFNVSVSSRSILSNDCEYDTHLS